MSDKQVIVTLEDGFGRVQTSIATSLSAPQLIDKIMEIDKQQATITALKEENEQLRQQLKEKEEDERLYANEIVELRKTNEEHIKFKSLGGDY